MDDVEDPTIIVLTANNEKTAYHLVIKELIDVFEDCNNLINLSQAGIIQSPLKPKDIIYNILNANKEMFDNEPIIPEEVIDEFYKTIKTFDNGFQIIHDLKQNNPTLFKRISSKNGSDTAAGMGELGF